MGYFNRATPVVGSMGSPINFWGIYCRDEFNEYIKKRYTELQVSFLTPAELFTPWYGHIIARHLAEHRKHKLGVADDAPLNVVEVGGGNGTLARDVLDWTRDNRPDAYARSSYTCIEISSSLAAQQYENVVVRGGHGAHFRISAGNAWDRAAWGAADHQHTFVLMMEVLDNLPHDRVFRAHSSQPWQQTLVSCAPSAPTMASGPWVEEGVALEDELVQRCLAATYKPHTLEDRVDGVFNKALDWLLGNDTQQPVERGEVVFVPTACLSLLDLLQRMRPNHSLIAADFDMLPGVKVAGTCAPLVAEKVDGQAIDHDTILVPWGTADIFFPTNFDALASLYRASAHHVWGDKAGVVETSHFRQGEVMKRYREMAKTATICAFNPMIDDFLNARFFFGDSRGRHPPGYVPPPPPPPRLRRDAPQGPASRKPATPPQQPRKQSRAVAAAVPPPGVGGNSQAAPTVKQQPAKQQQQQPKQQAGPK